MKRLFTLVELIIVIVVLGVLAVIVIPNISSMKEKSISAAITSDTKNIQTSLDMHQLENKDLPTINIVEFGNPQLIDFEKLIPKYLRDKPKQGYFWIDSNKIVYGADIFTPLDVKFKNGTLSWKGEGDNYQVFEVRNTVESNASKVNIIPIGEITNNKVMTGLNENNVYLVASQDKYGHWTPPVGENYVPTYYEGDEPELITKNIEFDEDIHSEQIKTFTINNLNEITSITSDNGEVEVLSINGDEVTIKLSDGHVVRKEQIGGEYIPEDSKYIENYQVKDFSCESTRRDLNIYDPADDNKNNNRTFDKWVSGGSTTGYIRHLYKEDGYEGVLESPIGKYCEDINIDIDMNGESLSHSQLVNKLLNLLNNNEDINTYKKAEDLLVDNGGGLSYFFEMDDFIVSIRPIFPYPGGQYITAEFRDPTTFKNIFGFKVDINDFQGIVTKPEVDTRIYNEFYKYNIEIEYNFAQSLK